MASLNKLFVWFLYGKVNPMGSLQFAQPSNDYDEVEGKIKPHDANEMKEWSI